MKAFVILIGGLLFMLTLYVMWAVSMLNEIFDWGLKW